MGVAAAAIVLGFVVAFVLPGSADPPPTDPTTTTEAPTTTSAPVTTTTSKSTTTTKKPTTTTTKPKSTTTTTKKSTTTTEAPSSTTATTPAPSTTAPQQLNPSSSVTTTAPASSGSTGLTAQTKLWLVVGGLIAVGVAIATLTVLYWRRTRPPNINSALDALADIDAHAPPVAGGAAAAATAAVATNGPITGVMDAVPTAPADATAASSAASIPIVTGAGAALAGAAAASAKASDDAPATDAPATDAPATDAAAVANPVDPVAEPVVPTPLPWSDPKSTAGVGPGITILGPVAAATASSAGPDPQGPAYVGATVDPGPLKIVTVEDLELAEQQAQADADLSALIAPRNEGVGENGAAHDDRPADSASPDEGSTVPADAEYRDADG